MIPLYLRAVFLVLLILALGLAVVGYACCVVAARADEEEGSR